jgi:predicted DNA-binding transcriptional regulator AlpA
METTDVYGDELLDFKGLARRWGTSIRTLHRLTASGQGPRPVRISKRVVRWRLSEVRRWEAALERNDGGKLKSG